MMSMPLGSQTSAPVEVPGRYSICDLGYQNGRYFWAAIPPRQLSPLAPMLPYPPGMTPAMVSAALAQNASHGTLDPADESALQTGDSDNYAACVAAASAVAGPTGQFVGQVLAQERLRHRDPLWSLLNQIELADKPTLPWVTRWSAGGEDPLAAAFRASREPNAMLAVLDIAFGASSYTVFRALRTGLRLGVDGHLSRGRVSFAGIGEYLGQESRGREQRLAEALHALDFAALLPPLSAWLPAAQARARTGRDAHIGHIGGCGPGCAHGAFSTATNPLLPNPPTVDPPEEPTTEPPSALLEAAAERATEAAGEAFCQAMEAAMTAGEKPIEAFVGTLKLMEQHPRVLALLMNHKEAFGNAVGLDFDTRVTCATCGTQAPGPLTRPGWLRLPTTWLKRESDGAWACGVDCAEQLDKLTDVERAMALAT